MTSPATRLPASAVRGGQHACLVADVLGIDRIMIHPLAGVLSAYGMGLADMIELRQQSLRQPLDRLVALETLLADLGRESRAALTGRGVAADTIVIHHRAALRYEGSDSSIEIAVSDPATMRATFEDLHRQRFGLAAEETGIVTETAIAEAVAAAPTEQMMASAMA